jgi:hypothetical protein
MFVIRLVNDTLSVGLIHSECSAHKAHNKATREGGLQAPLF